MHPGNKITIKYSSSSLKRTTYGTATLFLVYNGDDKNRAMLMAAW
jgi:hypothetical protein